MWSFANFRGVDPDYEEALRAAAIQLRGSHLKRPPAAAQWMRLGQAEGLATDSAGLQVVSELKRLDKILTTVRTDVADA